MNKPTANPTERRLAYAEASQHKTNHILHLLLSCLTLGAWSAVWLLIAASNTSQRNKVWRQYQMPPESNLGLLVIAFFMIIFITALVSS